MNAALESPPMLWWLLLEVLLLCQESLSLDTSPIVDRHPFVDIRVQFAQASE
jgi:hypothetical protein